MINQFLVNFSRFATCLPRFWCVFRSYVCLNETMTNTFRVRFSLLFIQMWKINLRVVLTNLI